MSPQFSGQQVVKRVPAAAGQAKGQRHLNRESRYFTLFQGD